MDGEAGGPQVSTAHDSGAEDGEGTGWHLSPSSASMFAQCPRRWRFRYVEREPDPPGAAALAGTLVHRVLERLLGEPPPHREVERARALAGEEWPAHAEHPDVVRMGFDADAARAHKWKVWQAIAGLWQLEDPRQVDVVATEQRVKVELDGVPFVGVIDRVDRTRLGTVVTDYKSGRPPGDRFVAPKLDQVLLYAAALAAHSGRAPVRARLLYLGARNIDVEADPASMAGAVARLRQRWDDLQRCLDTDRFDPSPGPLCAWCPYAARCPEGTAVILDRIEAGMVPVDAPARRRIEHGTGSPPVGRSLASTA